MAKLPPCATTRCFIPAIHPRQYPEDVVTLRLQLRKSPRFTWREIALCLTHTNWPGIFAEPRLAHPQGQTLVASVRLRPASAVDQEPGGRRAEKQGERRTGPSMRANGGRALVGGERMMDGKRDAARCTGTLRTASSPATRLRRLRSGRAAPTNGG